MRFSALLIAGLLTAIVPAAAQDGPDDPFAPPPTAPQIPDGPSLDNPALDQRPPQDTSSDRAAQSALAADPAKELDDLFAQLAAAKSPMEAHPVEQRILRRLALSGSATVDLLMTWMEKAVEKKDFPAALDLVDQALALKPDYVEGYNRRATLHYILDDYTRSVQDIQRTLSLEPRHFGALSGLGAILTELDQPDRAREIYHKALEINPHLASVKEALEELDKRTGGRDL